MAFEWTNGDTGVKKRPKCSYLLGGVEILNLNHNSINKFQSTATNQMNYHALFCARQTIRVWSILYYTRPNYHSNSVVDFSRMHEGI